MRAPEHVETARLRLSPPDASHAAMIYQRYASDADVTRYLGWPRHLSIADTEAFLAFSQQEWERWPGGPYLIWSRETGALVGGTGFGFQTEDEAITGYVLAKDAWGRGYATEALTAIVQVARDIRLRRLVASCHTEHRASRRVLEKCGFVQDSSRRQIEFPNLAPGVPLEAARYVLDVTTPPR